MVQTVGKKEATSSPDGTKKQRKKQAKQEAKTMLKLEQAKKNEQKAEKKITKMQERLETFRMRIHKFEAKLNEIRSPHYEPTAEAAEVQPGAEEHEPVAEEAEVQPDAEEHEPAAAGEENVLSENHAHISTSPYNQEVALSEKEDQPDIAPGQKTVQPADDYTYIPVGSEATFVEEGE